MRCFEFRDALLSAGSWRNTADDFSQSRLAIAG